MLNGKGLKICHYYLNTENGVFAKKKKKIHAKHMLPTDEFLIKMLNNFQVKHFYMASEHFGNCSCGTLCPL